MILRTVRVSDWLSLCAIVCLNALVLSFGQAQEIRWLRVGELQSFVTDIGVEYEGQGTTGILISSPGRRSIVPTRPPSEGGSSGSDARISTIWLKTK